MESRVTVSINGIDADGVEDEELAGHHTAREDALVDCCSALFITVPVTAIQ